MWQEDWKQEIYHDDAHFVTAPSNKKVGIMATVFIEMDSYHQPASLSIIDIALRPMWQT